MELGKLIGIPFMSIGRGLRGFVLYVHTIRLVTNSLSNIFYEGLTTLDRSMINAASGGAMVDKIPLESRNLIANIATNSQ